MIAGRKLELDPVDRNVAAVEGHLLAFKQTPRRHQSLLEQGEWGRDGFADLRHPLLDAVADAGDETAGVHLGQGGPLHGQRHRVAERRRGDAVADPGVLGCAEDRGELGDAAGEG